jgi:drug/metabolite transporter (DMT)-like permease
VHHEPCRSRRLAPSGLDRRAVRRHLAALYGVVSPGGQNVLPQVSLRWMGGMLLLLSNELAVLRAAPVGALLVVAAAVSWAMGTVLIKRFPTALPTTSFTGWQFLLGGLPIVIGALLIDTGKLQPLSWQAAIALAYNMVVAFILCHWIWFEVVSRASATVSSIGTLSIPVVGVFSSILVLGERPDWREYAALVLVLAAIATVLVPARAQGRAGSA